MSAWTAEEDRILIDNFDKSKSQIAKVLRSCGYERTEDGVRRRRQRLRYAGAISDSYISTTMTTEEEFSIPPTNPIIDNQVGFSIKRVSTNYDGDGNIRQQWVSEDKDKEELIDQMKEAVAALIEPCKGLSLNVPAPIDTTKDLLTIYPIADIHLGQFSWADETGEDYDLKICEKILNDSMTELIRSTPDSETCLIANLGDFFHSDSLQNKTMLSGNILDVDSRWPKIVQVGTEVYRTIINLALQKHKKVIVKSAIGNHDAHASLWLAMAMRAYFANNERVEIELPVSHFAYYTFGKNLIGITHGGIKADRLPGIMACDQSVSWGNTEFRTFLTGHRHHKEIKEFPGVTVETFRAVASKDAWTHNSGYRAQRSLEAVVLHKTLGESGRRIVNIL